MRLTIKKYKNRKLYIKELSRYTTLSELSSLLKEGYFIKGETDYLTDAILMDVGYYNAKKQLSESYERVQ